MFGPMEPVSDMVIRVTGVGGGGGNTVEHMVRERIEGVEFFAVDIDVQALRKMAVGQTVQIGSGIIEGLSTGANPEVGRNATDENRDALRVALGGVGMVLIAADMGDGTSIGTAPAAAEVAKDLGVLTVVVVTKSFSSEGKKHMASVEQETTELSKHVDSLIIIPNGKLPRVLSRDISLLDTSGVVNDVLKGAMQSIVGLITRPGLMNVDFADVRTIMSEMGYAMMGFGVASGKDCAEEAAEMATPSPLLEDIGLSGIRNMLVNITAGFDLRLDEFETVGNIIRAFASDNMTVVTGTSLGPDMDDELRIIVVATGTDMDKHSEIILVTNKQVQQPVVDRYQQHGMAPLAQEQKPVTKVVNDNAP